MNDTIQQIIIELQRQKRTERFPDHVCAQANEISKHLGNVSETASLLKYGDKAYEELNENMIKHYLMQTAAACIRMIEELEKEKACK